MALIEIKNIRKDFSNGVRTIQAVNGISLQLEEKDMTAITGPSGAGKSTFLQICAGLMKPSGGQVLFEGKDIGGYNGKKIADFRRNKVGYVFQQFNLLPMLTARENIAVPSLLNNQKPSDEQLNRLAEKLGIEGRLDHFPGELSGGEQQRVAIARALINDPKCIFADEPTGNLDRANASEVMEIFVHLHNEGKMIVIVTHDPEVVRYCTRTIHIRDGKLV